MAFTLLPKDTSFFDLFDQLAGKVLDAARALEEMLERWDRLEAKLGVEVHETDASTGPRHYRNTTARPAAQMAAAKPHTPIQPLGAG